MEVTLTSTETYLDKLTELQDKIGYTPGRVHPVALLGLMGEIGEVADESTFVNDEATPDDQLAEVSLRSYAIMDVRNGFVEHAAALDGLKKRLRSQEKHLIAVEVHETKFDKELADAFYYLKAVARGRNLTIEDLSRMSYEKVIERRGVVNQGDPAR